MPDKSIHFLLHSLDSTQPEPVTFLAKLQECIAKLNTKGFTWPAQFLQVSNYAFRDIAVGPSHVAVLLQDGKIARFSITVFADRISTKGEPNRSNKPTGGAGGGGGGALGSASSASVLASRTAKIRRVMMAARSGRGGRGVIVGSRPLIPASAIPEDLIAQAQVVLQGKSRESIVKELQRTNLDVNLAVNNLLSREDDDGDDGEDGQDAYLPEELISLLDAGLQSGDHPSVILDADAFYSGDVFEYASAAARRRAQERADKVTNERGSDRGESGTNLRSLQPINAITPGCALEFWNGPDGEHLRFSYLAGLRSEAVAVGLEDGKLYSWPWDSEKPVLEKHPKSERLGLNQHYDEWITQLSSSLCRCTLMTSSNRVASFMDAALGVTVEEMLDVPLMDLPDAPTGVLTSTLFSCAKTKNEQVFWWGVFPFAQRRKQWEKMKSKSRKRVTFDTNEIKEGSEVKMRSNPVYQVGALGFTTVNGFPQVGELMEAAWTLSETCRFRIKNEKELREEVFYNSPSVTKAEEMEASQESEVKNVFYEQLRLRMKRPASQPLKEEPGHKEEAWSLKEVTFVREGRVHDVGKVVKVDNAYCGVIFPTENGEFPENDADKLKAVRLMRKDELQVVSSGVAPRCPETVQKVPKSLELPKEMSVLDLCIDNAGFRILAERQGKLVVARSSLNGRVDSITQVPGYIPAFKGTLAQTPRIISFGEEHLTLLIDGNGCLFPLSKDSVGGFREGVPLMMGPVEKMSLGVHPTKPGASGKSTRAAVTVLTLKMSTLLEHVLHCDLESVKQFVSDLENDKNLDKAQEEIVNSRVDGNRNILHAAVVYCCANKNKENVDGGSLGVGEDTPVGGAGALATRSAYEARWEQMIAGQRRSTNYGVADMLEYASRRFERSGSMRDSPLGGVEALSPVLGRSASDQPAHHPPSSMPSLRNHWPPSENPPVQQHLDAPVPALGAGQEINTAQQEGEGELADIPLPPMPATPKTVSDPKERQGNALAMLKFLCEHPFMTSYLLELLTTRDINGQTPFMLAVSIRAYSAALTLWDTAERLARATSQYMDALMQMIYPEGSLPDDSPLFVLCYNDTCSFTWTGDEHINQDIFECKTCALVGSLCCCTECAHVCHKNHDCKLKKTSPTAYCDCWERCKCKALISGNQTKRFEVLNKLLRNTDLVTKTNMKGEHLILFLVKTVGRQAVEQRQHRPMRSKQQQQKSDGDLEMPEHDLSPPQFAKQALDYLLRNWSAVKSMLLLGCKDTDKSSLMDEDQFYLSSQDGATYLDQFVNCLVGRCTQDLLVALVSTLIQESQKAEPDPRVHEVIRRFTRSLVRVFIVSSICSSPAAGKRKNLHQTILKCRSAFEALISYSVLDLAAAADAILAPVRMGMLKPTQQFSLLSSTVDIVDVVEKLFSGAPVPVTEIAPEEVGKGRQDREAGEVVPMETADSQHVIYGSHSSSSRDAIQRRTENRDEIPSAADIESDSDSEPEISRAENIGGISHLVRSQGFENLAEAENSENSNLDDSLAAPTSARVNGDRDLSLIGAPTSFADDSLDDVGRDVYYSDGESVDSGSRHDDQDEPMEQEESGAENLDRDGVEDTSFSDNPRDTEETAEDSGESESESDLDRNSSSAEPTEELSGMARHKARQRRQLAHDVYDTLVRTTAAATTAADGWARAPPPPTLSWASRTNRARDAGGLTAPQSLAASAANTAAATTGSNAQTTNTSAGTVPPPERGGGFIFLDTSVPPPTMRRSSGFVASSQSVPDSGGTKTQQEQGSTATLMSASTLLARAFGIVSRQIADLMLLMSDYKTMAPNLPSVLVISQDEVKRIGEQVSQRLKPSWDWLFAVLDSVEGQLKFGSALATATDLSQYTISATSSAAFSKAQTESARGAAPAPHASGTAGGSSGGSARTTPSAVTATGHGSQSGGGTARLVTARVGALVPAASEASSLVPVPHPPSVTYDPRRRVMLISSTEPVEQAHHSSARRDFVHYLLSLLRGQSEEHADDFPVLDVSSLRHVAYVADAYLYYLEVMSKAQSLTPDEESDFYIENLETRMFNSSFAPELKEEDPEGDSEDKQKPDEKTISPGKLRKFFQRSKSILYPGVSLRLGPFDHSVAVGLPLAEKPHLLKADASKQRMFGLYSRQATWAEQKEDASEYGLSYPTHLSLCTPNEELEKNRKPGFDPPATEQKDKNTTVPSHEEGANDIPRPQSVIVHAGDAKMEGEEKMEEPAIPETAKAPADLVMDSLSMMKPPEGVGEVTMEELVGGSPQAGKKTALSTQKLLGRWKYGLTVLAKVFSDEIGTEPGSILVQMAGFPVRESRFRKEMEKLRSGQRDNKDDLILEVDRERHLLIQQTIKQLNQRFNRRLGAMSGAPLTVHKVKVTFKDEPGEGSGVARSFYAAIAEALLSPDRLPNLEICQVTPSSMSPTRSHHSQVLMNRLRQRERQREVNRRRISRHSGQRFPLSVDAPPFFVPGDSVGAPPPNLDRSVGPIGSAVNWDPSKQTLGERLLPKVRTFRSTWANKVTGMLLELPAHQVVNLLTNDDLLRGHVEDAMDLILAQQSSETQQQQAAVADESDNSNDGTHVSAATRGKKLTHAASTPTLLASDKGPVLDPDEMIDSAPLFFQPGKTGFYSPIAGKNSAERLNAFRNVGRLIGICLLQNEVFPLHLCRHVLKFVLGRPVTWYDLAFFDSALFESLRSLAQHKGDINELDLTFSLTLSQEEGGQTIDLKPNGSSIPVTRDNVIEYIYRYVEYRIITLTLKPLEALKQGVFDVLPSHSLEGLTAEDMRLLLCGTHDFSTKLLQSYTTFADESSASAEQLSRFKKWFWAVVDKMKTDERQDLVYFWTGSPALPSSEEGFQPLPSVMIRPADDHHLPTANTCISRLYVPLYSSKQVLKQKLLLAVKARNFGFV